MDFLSSFISIHAPREGSDWYIITELGSMAEFQSTLPVRGATVQPESTAAP